VPPSAVPHVTPQLSRSGAAFPAREAGIVPGGEGRGDAKLGEAVQRPRQRPTERGIGRETGTG
jgi:hypothetical protein